MTTESCRRDVLKHQQEIARLQTEKARETSKVADEKKRANTAADSARRATSLSSIQSRIRDVQKHEEAGARSQKKVADIETRIAREQIRLNDAHKRLASAEIQEGCQKGQEQQRAAQENARRMASLAGTVSQNHQLTMSALKKLEQLPRRIIVLFLAANPIDQQQLRLDEEVRGIEEMIRKSQHRDAVDLKSRWAVRPMDVLQAINEIRPTVVHFSGHGSDQDEIVFQDNAGNAKLVSKEAIVQTMAAGSDDIQLVFFNTCYSRGQAKAVVEHVPAAIGMNTSIGDDAARVFSSQFYSALGFGLSVRRAFQQARAALMLEGIPEEATPELFTTEGLEADNLILVQSVGAA